MMLPPGPAMKPHASSLVRALTALLLLSQITACKKVTALAIETPFVIEARPPADPLPDLPPVPQPPPPPRVTLEGELLVLDEALSFDEAGTLKLSEHEDILAEVAKWLAAHDEVLVLAIEAQSIGEGSRRTHGKRSKALAQQVADALTREGIVAERLQVVGLGKSEDGQRHVALRVSERRSEP